MTERKKSWAEMTDRNSEWFTWADILEMTDGRQEVTLRVTSARQGKIKQSDKRVVALTLDGAKKPLGLNATNAKTITAIYGTDKPADWEAQRILITLYVGQARDPDGGGQCNCVRVRNRKPNPSEVHGAKYDRESARAALSSASDSSTLSAVRAAITSQRPPKEDHEAIKAWVAEAEARIAGGAQ